MGASRYHAGMKRALIRAIAVRAPVPAVRRLFRP